MAFMYSTKKKLLRKPVSELIKRNLYKIHIKCDECGKKYCTTWSNYCNKKYGIDLCMACSKKGSRNGAFGKDRSEITKYSRSFVKNHSRNFTEQQRKNISNSLKGRKLSREHRQKIRDNGKATFKGKTHTEETKRKLRKSLSERKIKLGGGANFNVKACELFEKLNNKLKLEGQHGLNGGEYYVKNEGYWLDFYSIKYNIAIEYYESYHYANQKQIDKDVIRIKRIEDALNTRVIIINIDTNLFTLWRELKKRVEQSAFTTQKAQEFPEMLI